MTSKVAGKVNALVKSRMDREFNPDAFIDELHQEYDHRVANAHKMCDAGSFSRCKAVSKLMPYCSWPDYLECNRNILLGRKQEVVANQGTVGGSMSEDELGAVLYMLELSIVAIEKYQRKARKGA
jgi:hypothetical protein